MVYFLTRVFGDIFNGEVFTNRQDLLKYKPSSCTKSENLLKVANKFFNLSCTLSYLIHSCLSGSFRVSKKPMKMESELASRRRACLTIFRKVYYHHFLIPKKYAVIL